MVKEVDFVSGITRHGYSTVIGKVRKKSSRKTRSSLSKLSGKATSSQQPSSSSPKKSPSEYMVADVNDLAGDEGFPVLDEIHKATGNVCHSLPL
jgi:hypothetical protein